MKKVISILLALGLALSLSLVMVVPAAAATINVPGDYPTIQAAIDAANPDDTILVAAGTYVEAVLIGKPLTLQGEPGAIIKPDGNTPTYDPYGAPFVGKRRAGIYIYQVDGVIIDGFEIDGTATDVHYGIIGKYSDSSTVRNCVVHDIVNQIGAPGSDVAGVGIMFYNEEKAGWSGVHDVIIQDNVVYETGRMGIFLGGWTGGWLLSSNNVIKDNELYDTWQGPTAGSGGAVTFLGASNSLIQRNTVYDTGLDQFGIRILALGSDTNYIIENDICNNYAAIGVTGAPEVHCNNIYNNQGYGLQNLGTEMVDATNNWWGDASGPSHSPGSGDKVSDNVTYDPWLPMEFQYCEVCGGTPPPPPPVGGEAYPVNKFAILAPWIAIGVAIVAGAVIGIRRHTIVIG